MKPVSILFRNAEFKKVFIGTLFILIMALNSSAQGLFEEMSKVPVLTPQAASFAKYVEFPVNTYNGVPEISIPLYTIATGDIQHPISLSYHAGGLRVAEEASWVGLGWNLNVGGVISRQIMGKDDFLAIDTYYGKVLPTPGGTFNPMASNSARYPLCNAFDVNGSTLSNTTTLSEGDLTALPSHDGEPDVFMYNFGSYSGKFLHVEDNIDIGRNNIVFDVSSTGITATTPDGFKYEFGYVEKGWVGTNPQTVMSYYLTKVTSPTGKVLNFTYTSLSNIKQMPSFSDEYGISYGLPGSFYNGSPAELKWRRSYNWANPVFLIGITWDNGSIVFSSSSRQDMDGKKLDQMIVKNKDGSIFDTFTFNYNYFIGTLTRHHDEPGYPQSPDPSLAYPVDYLKKRLKLLNIQQQGNGSVLPGNYITHYFEYYEGGNLNLPYKSSYATDFWGYYNGKSTNKNFVPSGIDVVTGTYNQSIYNFLGANKKPDEAYIKANMLKKITYPTKGTTTYNYSIHTYTNTDAAPPIHQQVTLGIASDPPTQEVSQQATFTYGGGEVDLQIALYCNCTNNQCECDGNSEWGCGNTNLSGLGPNVLYAQLQKQNPSTGVFEPISQEYLWDANDMMPCEDPSKNPSGDFSVKVNLAAGTYKMVVNYPDNKTGSLGSKMAHMVASYDGLYYPSSAVGGGVRVSSITHYDPEKNVSLSETFTYSNGVLMHFPRYYWRKPDWKKLSIDNPQTTPYEFMWVFGCYETLYSSPVTPYSSSASGSAVGYGTVVETLSGTSNGKVEYIFENQPDYFQEYGATTPSTVDFSTFHSYAPGIGSVARQQNGFLKEKTVFDADNLPVSKTTQTPTVVSGRTYWCDKPERLTTDFSDPAFASVCESEYGIVMNYFYPVQIGKVVPSVTMDTQYENGVATLTTTKLLQYNNQALLKEESVTDSDNKVLLTEYKYAKDYNNAGWISDLYTKNIVGVPLEKTTKVSGNTIKGTFVKYKTANGFTTPNEIYSIKTDIPKTIPSTAPTGSIPSDFKLDGTMEFNTEGNLSYKQSADNIKVSYIWGYNNLLPVAEVVNASPGQVYYNSFEEATTGTTTVSRTGKKGFSGSFNVPLPAAGAGSYKLTYWRKSGGLWEYIEDTMTGSARSIGGAGVILDDIRVYPVGATITTYTYDPLLGITSSTDTNGNISSYEYDSFGRLKLIRDMKGKILSHYSYHYKN